MEVIIKTENGNVSIREISGDEQEIINAYAVALAGKCKGMFKKKESALMLLESAYEFSKSILDDLYEEA